MSDPETIQVTPTTRADEAALRRVQRVSYLLDDAIRIPGTNRRIGLDPIVGLIPVVGDLIATLFSAYVIFEAYRLGAPRRLLARMVLNVLVDTLVGSIPVAGDVFDALWKANERNVALLERYVHG